MNRTVQLYPLSVLVELGIAAMAAHDHDTGEQ